MKQKPKGKKVNKKKINEVKSWFFEKKNKTVNEIQSSP